MTDEIQITASMAIKVPMTPNFLQRRQLDSIPIETLTDEQLREVGRAWTEALVEKARSRRATEVA